MDIILAIIAIALPIITFFAGIRWNQRQNAKNQKDQRFQNILDCYMDFRRINKTGGLDGLVRSGVSTLQSDAEIRRLMVEIQKYGENHPFGDKASLIDNLDLKSFFDWITDNKIKVLTKNPEKLIAQYNGDKEG